MLEILPRPTGMASLEAATKCHSFPGGLRRGERVGEKRLSFQPRLGASVDADDGPAGTVAYIIINPRNRLVSYTAAQPRSEVNGGTTARGQFVVPVQAIEVVSDSGVFLTDTLRDLAARPAFREADFPPAPPDWPPPFPYGKGTVRWPRVRNVEHA